jgi:hypothetical protein
MIAIPATTLGVRQGQEWTRFVFRRQLPAAHCYKGRRLRRPAVKRLRQDERPRRGYGVTTEETGPVNKGDPGDPPRELIVAPGIAAEARTTRPPPNW